MHQAKIRRLVYAAMMAAVVCVLTWIVRIPSPTGGYKNVGDTAVLLAGWILGPIYGGLAAAVGSAMSDLLSGFPHYVPATFIIKGLMAVAAYFLRRYLSRREGLSRIAAAVSGAAGELIMIAGYFGFSVLLLGRALSAAVSSLLGNAFQAVICLAAALILNAVFSRSREIQKITNDFTEALSCTKN